MAGAGYLACTSLAGGAVAGCGPGSGCHEVLSNRWAYWLGLPVSVPAFFIYLAQFALTFRAPRNPAAWFWVAALAWLMVLAALWFVFLQYAAVGSWCKFCLGTHLCGVLSAGILLRQAGSPPRRALALALAVFAVLAVGQAAVKKQMFASTPLAGASPPGPARNLQLGAISLDPDQLPMIGASGGTNFVICLFDYTCAHCRRLHPLLKLAQPGAGVAILTLPVPLDADCNPLVERTSPGNFGACDYARLGLAIWHAQPSKLAEFDDWMFDSAFPPPLPAARAKAEDLLGKNGLDAALRDPWVARQLQTDVALYVADARATHQRTLPQLLFRDALINGTMDDAAEVTQVIHAHQPLQTEAP
jgi:uncharacterized membrane protein